MTLIFAVYVAALIPALLVAGPLSDAIGRRRVLLPALALAAVGALGFAFATDTAWLFIARILQGVAVGAASGALTAALTESEPHGNQRRAALVSTVTSVAGLALGPVLAGLLAQYVATEHDTTPFLVEVGLLIPAAVTVWRMPSTQPTTRWRPRRPQLPPAMRTVCLTSGTASFLAFAVIGLFLTLMPAHIATLTHSTNLLLTGGTSALILVCSAIAQLIVYGRSPRHLQLVGLPLLALGLGLLLLANTAMSPALLLGAAVSAGIGHGAVFLGGLTTVNSTAPDTGRAETLSTFYVIVYTDVGLPVLGVGILATALDLTTAVNWFAGSVTVACLLVLAALGCVDRRPPSPAP